MGSVSMETLSISCFDTGLILEMIGRETLIINIDTAAAASHDFTDMNTKVIVGVSFFFQLFREIKNIEIHTCSGRPLAGPRPCSRR